MMQPDEMKALRKQAGLKTQSDLALALGMHKTSIADMERGAAPIEKRTELAVRFLVMMAERAREH